jgi:hypothetical protein
MGDFYLIMFVWCICIAFVIWREEDWLIRAVLIVALLCMFVVTGLVTYEHYTGI